MKVRNISVQIPETLDAWLEAEAEKEFCSKSAIARKILARHVNNQPKAPVFGMADDEEMRQARRPARIPRVSRSAGRREVV